MEVYHPKATVVPASFSKDRCGPSPHSNPYSARGFSSRKSKRQCTNDHFLNAMATQKIFGENALARELHLDRIP